jgi:hypothetical protein
VNRKSFSEDVTFKMRTEGGRAASHCKIRGKTPTASYHCSPINIQNNYRLHIKDRVPAKRIFSNIHTVTSILLLRSIFIYFLFLRHYQVSMFPLYIYIYIYNEI